MYLPKPTPGTLFYLPAELIFSSSLNKLERLVVLQPVEITMRYIGQSLITELTKRGCVDSFLSPILCKTLSIFNVSVHLCLTILQHNVSKAYKLLLSSFPTVHFSHPYTPVAHKQSFTIFLLLGYV